MQKFNTYFCDIDGTILKYRKFETYESSKAEGIKSTIEYLDKASVEGHMIILTTARPEYLRMHTEIELYENDQVGMLRGCKHSQSDKDKHE